MPGPLSPNNLFYPADSQGEPMVNDELRHRPHWRLAPLLGADTLLKLCTGIGSAHSYNKSRGRSPRLLHQVFDSKLVGPRQDRQAGGSTKRPIIPSRFSTSFEVSSAPQDRSSASLAFKPVTTCRLSMNSVTSVMLPF